MFSYFSKHAIQRLRERSTLTPEDLLSMLEDKLFIHTGVLPGFNREHLLLYSMKDDEFFVVIRDSLVGKIITILPLEYHENLAWPLMVKDCELAKLCVLNQAKNAKKIQSETKSSIFTVSVHYRDLNNFQKTKCIQKLNAAIYQNDIDKLIENKKFFENLYIEAETKNIWLENIFAVTIRRGNRGVAVTIDLEST